MNIWRACRWKSKLPSVFNANFVSSTLVTWIGPLGTGGAVNEDLKTQFIILRYGSNKIEFLLPVGGASLLGSCRFIKSWYNCSIRPSKTSIFKAGMQVTISSKTSVNPSDNPVDNSNGSIRRISSHKVSFCERTTKQSDLKSNGLISFFLETKIFSISKQELTFEWPPWFAVPRLKGTSEILSPIAWADSMRGGQRRGMLVGIWTSNSTRAQQSHLVGVPKAEWSWWYVGKFRATWPDNA